MIPPEGLAPEGEREDDMLTRAEASVFLRRFHIGLKPASLARMWSVGRAGPPCEHIRGKPFYPRSALRAWAEAQRTGVRASRSQEPTRSAGREVPT